MGHLIEEKQQHVSTYFKTNFKEWVKKFVALLKKEEWLRKNVKMMSLTFFELYSVYKKLGQLFLYTYLLTFLKKDISVLLTVRNI